MLRIGSIVLNVSDIGRASAFWSAALGHTPRPGRPEVLAPSGGDGPLLWLDEDDRTHLDLWTDSAEEQRAEVERLLALGATRVEWEYPDGADFVVLADPEGNLFCVIDTAAE
ncbi:VOC family protein [Streptomyces ipomoeae]|jgi:catechol 2,3-dioxygenase-like lactoylglutathione lyase family enzyme|uniref:Glyoxalase family protein n=2 Tax=Streptomyces ipomoeae TaxID=103232 RepID=L1KUK2_9ACTN|nr:VOC family protein [Streptomyces ipomoeae]EKX64486.1 glyoxalase family protein [Streptomyces ipomoeae 91-03]MDX2700198.1 VOC family protein [Streptomyces ipomoeae]MDX2824792.1 VOC family protein [Streptomyces ipomoeae]MDX2845850.1 VOC family protein [Streptomyces ipomoeae]MDX2879657.1 VOC family protein [Streptomyces ipomoeae]